MTRGSSVSSSDRLKKAIERNRAKVARKEGRSSAINASPSQQSSRATSASSHPNSLSERLAKLKEKRLAQSTTRTSTRESAASFSSRITRPQSTVSTRSNPTTASKIEILRARRQKLMASPGQANQAQAITMNGQASQSREKGLGEKIVETNFSFFDRFFSSAIKALFAKTLRVVTWAICIFFLGVVIFGDRGVVDYMKRHQSFIGKVNQLKFLEKENEEIKFQIYRLENDPAYQRQIIRDYLGYIARDEYLVIFAENAAHSEAK